MPATLGGQITLLIGIFSLVGLGYAGVSMFLKARDDMKQHIEWLEELWLWYASQNPNVSVPKRIIERHMRLNGNSLKSKEERKEIYGHDPLASKND